MTLRITLLSFITFATLGCQQPTQIDSFVENPVYHSSEKSFIEAISAPKDSVKILISQEIKTSVLGQSNTRKLNIVFAASQDRTNAQQYLESKADIIKMVAQNEVENLNQFDVIDVFMEKDKQIWAQTIIHLNN